MSIEEIKCNGEVKQEALSSSDGLLTYRRRKRMRTGGESSYPQGDAGVSVDEQVFHLTSNQVKGKDFGWEHGNMVNGNRYHWKCKWCNFVGRSGGVTRLKKHLAGGWHVTQCAKVPRDISNTMNNHLLELRKKRLFNRKGEREKDDIDETNIGCACLDISVDEHHGQVGLSMQVTNHTEQSGRAAKSFETDGQHSRGSYPRSNFAIQQFNIDMAEVSDAPQLFKRTAKRYWTAGRQARASYRRSRSATQRSRTNMAKAMKEPHDIMLDTDICEQGDLAGTDRHWRSVLQHMLQLPDVQDGGGIKGSIIDALTNGPPGDNRKPKMSIIPMDTAEPKT